MAEFPYPGFRPDAKSRLHENYVAFAMARAAFMRAAVEMLKTSEISVEDRGVEIDASISGLRQVAAMSEVPTNA
jgi:hypothetical protein